MSWPRIAVPIVALLFVGQVALLAVWWTPFGWYAWGPRLVLPLIPALLVAACALGADDASTFVARFLAGRWLFPAGLAIIVIGLPQAVVLFHGSAPTQFFAHPVCQNISLIKNPTQFSACFVRTAWWKHPWMLQLGMRGLATRDGWLVAIAFATTITTLLAMARRAAREFMRGCMPAAGEIPTAVTRSS